MGEKAFNHKLVRLYQYNSWEYKMFMNDRKITLLSILNYLETGGKNLIWSILILNGFGDFEKGEYLGDIFYEIINSHAETKFFLTWDEIYEFSKKFSDILDFMIIGCDTKEEILETDKSLVELSLKKYPKGSEVKPIYRIMVDIDDGILRGIYAKDNELYEKCRKIFGPYPAPVYGDAQ